MTPVMSAFADENVSMASVPVSVPADLSPVKSWMAGLSPVRLVAPHPMEIFTGMTLPVLLFAGTFWTVLSTPSSSGCWKCASDTLTTLEVLGPDTPPSSSLAVALTVWSPQLEKLDLKEASLSVSEESPPVHCHERLAASADDGSV